MSLLNYKSKKLPSAIKKQIVSDAVDRVMQKYERNTESQPEPLSEERDPSDTMGLDTRNVPEKLKDSQKHGGPTEVLVQRLRESREE